METRIVCAAIRADDGSILVGIRHYSSDMISQLMARNDAEKFKNKSGKAQGFVDQRGNFYTREQAWGVAFRANQIVREVEGCFGKLYSENLY